jgi:DNA repair exonuclease SbcCD nuclease subunit
MFKFIHAADIHLDSPRGGIDRDADAPAEEIRHAPRQALENLVQLAIDEQVQFLLIAGDLYDGDWKDFRTGLFFVAQMVRLRDAGIPVFLIAGNHDAANKMTKTLDLPGNVRMFSEKRAHTLTLDELGIAIHGQSFAKPAVTDDLAAGYPAHDSGMFNIGLLHTCATRSGEHERYAPCTLDGLRGKEYQYWALGHIHKREILHRDPLIVFPGNLQGRHIRESGPKGCYLITVDDRYKPVEQFRSLDVLRWENCAVDVGDATNGGDVVQQVGRRLEDLVAKSDDRPLAVRVELRGASAAHQQLVAESHRWQHEIKAQGLLQGEGRVWIERVVLATTPPRDAVDLSEGPLGELLQYLLELKTDPGELADLARELEPLRQKLPPELMHDLNYPIASDAAGMCDLLDDVRQILTHRFVNRGGAK